MLPERACCSTCVSLNVTGGCATAGLRKLHPLAVQGLLGLLQIDTGVELSEAEGILAFLSMLILTGPSKHTNPRT